MPNDFQKDNGLEVDGVLKPGGPTIGKLGGVLGGGDYTDAITHFRGEVTNPS